MKAILKSAKRQWDDTELILNTDGSLYHIALKNEHIADKVIIVGDRNRVQQISKHFNKIEFKIENREFLTHTGTFNDVRITVIATGIGTDNVDIVLNELDAAININLEKKILKDELRQLQIVRIGTSGALQENIEVDSFVAAKYGLGLDGLLNFYKANFEKNEIALRDAFIDHMAYPLQLSKPYFVAGNQDLRLKIAFDMTQGITATASGFYGPQGRSLRIALADNEYLKNLSSFKWNQEIISNFEMETAAFYGLGTSLGHACCTVCAIIANRLKGEYSKNYIATIDRLIEVVLYRLTG